MRYIRIGNVSGATGDSPHAMLEMVKEGSVDVIVGDWLSEMNIAWNAIIKQENTDLGYEAGFLEQLEESIDTIVEKGIKVITNAGALNTPSLAREVQKLCDARHHGNIVVAAVTGDDISELLQDSEQMSRLGLSHLDHEECLLSDWDMKPLCGNAYIGAGGIRTALDAGADIVICGRVTDASPVMGAASWWHKWQDEDYHALAGALVAGHLIECGPYFLYELQGELYLNPDVVVDLRGVRVEESGTVDCVHVSGARGLPPPATTKAIIAAPGGFQAEANFYINGLDAVSKAEMMKAQITDAFKGSDFRKLSVELYGSQAVNPNSQQAGTLMLRVFAQARCKDSIDRDEFLKPIYALRMQSYPGYHMSLDFRTMQPKPFMEMFPVIIPMDLLSQQVTIQKSKTIIAVPSPAKTANYPVVRPSYETPEPVDLNTFGPVKSAPIGSVVHARSGDKADNSNVGFFVRHDDEYPWLKSMLTVSKLKELLGQDWEGREGKSVVERCEFPNILAVHL
ncbi:hypothetical protein E8E13_000153 [Curvularia kusanoi]|uniref:DUF1446-domain-containing protein n=1 Tax=Curvularia kusanoi TaxID=90978 RepID=A0A9P4W6F0_CURKU|nr:hypothetical protein E8E13_000153 [Curvularia kusanoi]